MHQVNCSIYFTATGLLRGQITPFKCIDFCRRYQSFASQSYVAAGAV